MRKRKEDIPDLEGHHLRGLISKPPPIVQPIEEQPRLFLIRTQVSQHSPSIFPVCAGQAERNKMHSPAFEELVNPEVLGYPDSFLIH